MFFDKEPRHTLTLEEVDQLSTKIEAFAPGLRAVAHWSDSFGGMQGWINVSGSVRMKSGGYLQVGRTISNIADYDTLCAELEPILPRKEPVTPLPGLEHHDALNDSFPDVQHWIDSWARGSFQHSNYDIALHILEEAIELCVSLQGSERTGIWERFDQTLKRLHDKIAESGPLLPLVEMADVQILLMTLAGNMEISLGWAVNEVMALNYERFGDGSALRGEAAIDGGQATTALFPERAEQFDQD